MDKMKNIVEFETASELIRACNPVREVEDKSTFLDVNQYTVCMNRKTQNVWIEENGQLCDYFLVSREVKADDVLEEIYKKAGIVPLIRE